MKLDINEVYHQYIVRIVIFSLFLYKRQIKKTLIYESLVNRFVNKRLPWKINLKIDTGIKLDKDDEREIILNEVLNGIESDYLTKVTATFKTPLKQITIEVDLSNEKKYQNFLYN